MELTVGINVNNGYSINNEIKAAINEWQDRPEMFCAKDINLKLTVVELDGGLQAAGRTGCCQLLAFQQYGQQCLPCNAVANLDIYIPGNYFG